MNYLAHAFLSGSNEKVLLGNFMGDFIKGKQYNNYEQEIARGVLLHREIDSFTDSNAIVTESKKILRPEVSHYAGVVVDIFYDHFLVQNWEKFSTIPLSRFIKQVYSIAQKYYDILPQKAQYMIPYMVQYDWLLNYGNMEGLQRSLKGISRRSRFHPPLEKALYHLEQRYDDFRRNFLTFFPILIEHCDRLRND